MPDTKTKLLDAALETLRTQGIAGASARAIATTAGVNQALVFYHFGSVDQLLSDACVRGAEQRVAANRERFAAVTSVRGLLDLGRQVHEEERAAGNVAALAQLLAGSQSDERLAPATATGLNLWVAELEGTLARVLKDTPLADVPGLSRAIAAAFIGLELYEGVDREGAAQALDALEQLASLVTVLDEMSPLVRRAVRGRLRKALRTP